MGALRAIPTRPTSNESEAEKVAFKTPSPLQCRDDVAYMYYRSLKTLKAPADLIKFLGSLTGEMPENAEPPSGNEWCKEPI